MLLFLYVAKTIKKDRLKIYRPIRFKNMDYKILPQVLANRLQKVTNVVIVCH